MKSTAMKTSTSTTTYRRETGRKEGLMASTFDSMQARIECGEFAAQFGHLPNVRQALRLAQTGQLSWIQVRDLFKSALADGLKAVA